MTTTPFAKENLAPRSIRWTALAALLVFSAGLAAAQDFVPLFNGKDLEGWEGDPAIWRVTNGTIEGSTHGNAIDPNSFLSTTKSYGDFILVAKVKWENPKSKKIKKELNN